MACSRAISALRISCSIRIRASLAVRSLSAFLEAISAIWLALRPSSSLDCSISAAFRSRSICSFRLLASIAARCTATSASVSMSARSFLDVAITSASLRMPTALKALFSSSDAKGVWSSADRDTLSSESPLRESVSVSASRTAEANSERFSCNSSIVRLAASDLRVSTSLPSIRPFSRSASKVLLPSVCEALAMASSSGSTET